MNRKTISEELRNNTYPGRGIIIGKSEDGENMVIVYFIMGRSVNSRNRVFIEQEGGIRTEAFDPAKLSDPSLVIYAPVRVIDGKTIVTNGDQTDTIYDFIKEGKTFEEALRTRTFEPDAPNFTPRVSGIVENGTYKLSILKSNNGNPDSAQRFFYEYMEPVAGEGHFIHTYLHDGNPIPSFEGDPTPMEIKGDIDSITKEVWESLNEENKVSLFVRTINLKSGEEQTRIINKNK
ncbi:MAG: inosine monophosphate cyclohydrolase [Ruminococcaceae bacterium]|nr:inosine monophosphate cyclohydrolase [Oscillospiraceae bacterium]MBQ9969846.1 IMP cyclohydrolase [Oscillospiraceae bacterium]